MGGDCFQERLARLLFRYRRNTDRERERERRERKKKKGLRENSGIESSGEEKGVSDSGNVVGNMEVIV